jgi:hypothetical protein
MVRSHLKRSALRVLNSSQNVICWQSAGNRALEGVERAAVPARARGLEVGAILRSTPQPRSVVLVVLRSVRQTKGCKRR